MLTYRDQTHRSDGGFEGAPSENVATSGQGGCQWRGPQRYRILSGVGGIHDPSDAWNPFDPVQP